MNTSVYRQRVVIALSSAFVSCVWTLDAFIPHSPAAHTTPSCLCTARSSYQPLKRRVRKKSRCFVLQRHSFVVPDANIVQLICRFTHYLSVWINDTGTSLASISIFDLSFFFRCEAPWEAQISSFTKMEKVINKLVFCGHKESSSAYKAQQGQVFSLKLIKRSSGQTSL